MQKFIIGILVLSVGVIVLAASNSPNRSATSDIVATSQAKAITDNVFYDWGDVKLDGGDVEASFMISNDGEEPLKLYSVTTSCTCTTAQWKDVDDSPLFGMHTKSPYILEVQPGEEAALSVIYDPAFHGPGGTGQIERTVTVATNDLDNPELSFQLKANVYP